MYIEGGYNGGEAAAVAVGTIPCPRLVFVVGIIAEYRTRGGGLLPQEDGVVHHHE